MSEWQPIAEADKDIATIIDAGEFRIGNSYPIWVRDEDGRVYEALWSDNGKKAYWWDIEGESPVDPVEFMPHPLDPRFGRSASLEWQSIDTAPLDEMLILCGHKWDGDRSPIKIGYWRKTHWHIFGASWKPTHWMHLPNPPEYFESGANAAANSPALCTEASPTRTDNTIGDGNHG